MSNYEDDFDEEIEESFEDSKAFKSKTPADKKPQQTSLSSNRDLKPANNYGSSSKDLDNKSKNVVRKTVPLSKIQPKKNNDDSDEEKGKKPLVLQNIPKKKKEQRRKNSYDDQIREELNQDQSPKIMKKKHDLKSLEQEVLRISKSYERKSVHSTPPKTQNSQSYNAGYFDRLRNLFEAESYNRSAKELEAENNRIRESLKELNDQLTKIVERSRLSNLAPRKVEFKHKHTDVQIQTTMREIENNQKILELTATEYTTLKARLDQIKSPTFIMDLEDKINDTKATTEQTKRLNKELHLENGNIGKNLDGIDKADGVAPVIQEANKKARELAVLKKKLNKLQEMNAAFEEENTAKSAKYEKLQEQYRKANSEASQYHVAAEDDRLATQHSGLVAQVRLLEDHMRFALNKNEKYLKSQVERTIEELYIENMKENEKLERLDEMIEEQKQVLREMIEKEEHRTDKATREVIGRIKASLDPHTNVESTNSEPQMSQIKSVNSLQSKPPKTNWKNQQNKYNDLPVYNVSKNNVKIDSLLNKKEKLKKELNLLKEKARNGEERTTSQTPKAETDRKEAFAQNKSNSKPNLRMKSKNVSEEHHSLQQAQQEKAKETQKVEERRNSRDNVNVKPDFAKPNLFKKSNQTSTSQKEILQLPETHSNNNHQNQVSDFDSHNTFKSPIKKEEQYSIPNSTKKNEELRLPETDNKITLSKNETPLGLKEQSKTFVTHQGGYNSSNKKEELSLPGMFNEPKKETKKEEIVFDTYQQKVQNHTLSNNNLSNNNNNLQINSNINNKTEDQDDIVIGGGRSRLNKLKKGTTTTSSYEPEKITGLELPGQKNPSTTNINQMPLTLESDKRDRTKLLTNNKEDDLILLPKENTNNNALKKSNDLNGLGFMAELTLENKDTEKKGGRDRSHLNEKKKDDEDFLFFGNEKKTTTVNQSKGMFDSDDLFSKEKKPTINQSKGFDPDELFGNNNNKKPAFENKKTDGFSVEKIGFDDNSTNFGNKNTLNQQSGRRDINGKSRNVGAMDEELFGGSINFNNNNNNNITKKETNNLFGEIDFGGFGKPEQSKPSNLANNNKIEEEPKVEIKRMRMNDLKKTDNREKEINLAQKAENGGGFFDELEL